MRHFMIQTETDRPVRMSLNEIKKHLRKLRSYDGYTVQPETYSVLGTRAWVVRVSLNETVVRYKILCWGVS